MCKKTKNINTCKLTNNEIVAKKKYLVFFFRFINCIFFHMSTQHEKRYCEIDISLSVVAK